jgi:ribosome-binding protein aMBF1 (putative translation factor)
MTYLSKPPFSPGVINCEYTEDPKQSCEFCGEHIASYKVVNDERGELDICYCCQYFQHCLINARGIERYKNG